MKKSARFATPTLIASLAVLCGLFVTTPRRATASIPTLPQDTPPNIIILLVDDMGYADINAFGGRFGYTPNLDALAKAGTTMTNFYAACAVCSPTRASVLTGCYPQTFGINGHFRDRAGEFLTADALTLAEILKDNGYKTAHIGKWHLGGLTLAEIEDRKNSSDSNAMPGPHEHGFDHYLTNIEDPTIRQRLIRERLVYSTGGQHMIRDENYNQPHNPDNWTKIKGDEALRFIDQFHKAGEPFFINLWFDVPHTPYEYAPPEFVLYEDDTIDVELDRPRHVINDALPNDKAKDDQARFLSMVTHMDHQVGRIRAKLDDLGIADNTLILFTSDNGGAWPADNGIFAAGKTSLREGGIRVPMCAVWPGYIPSNETTNALGHSNDLMPTALAAAGILMPNGHTIDGRSLFGHLSQGKPLADPDIIFWNIRNTYRLQRHAPNAKPHGNLAARRGDHKLLITIEGKPVALWDLSSDPSEERNLIDDPQFKTLIEELTTAGRAWLANSAMNN